MLLFNSLEECVVFGIIEQGGGESKADPLLVRGGRNCAFPFVYSIYHIPFVAILVPLFDKQLVNIFVNATDEWMLIKGHNLL